MVLDSVSAGLWPLLVDLERDASLDEWAANSRPVGQSNGGPDQPDVRESLSPEESLAGTSTTDLGAAPASIVIGYCIHGRPITSPSVRMECRDCFALARIEQTKRFWR